LFPNLFKAVGFAEGDFVPHKKAFQGLLGSLLAVKDQVVKQWWR
jgi:hypothetical protein